MLHWDLGAVLFWMGVGLLFSTLAAVIVRLLLQSATILWLIGCAGYAAQILWRV